MKYALAYTPPPLLLKPAPYVIAESARIPHPWFAVASTSQFVPLITVPDIDRASELLAAISHPAEVWSVA